MTDLLRDWAQAVTLNDAAMARAAYLAGAGKVIKLEKMDAKETEMYNRVSRDIEVKLVVLKKSEAGYDLGYSLNPAKSRTGNNVVSIGLCKSSIVLNEGDTATVTLGEVRPILKSGLYGCTASGMKVLYKSSGNPNSSTEIYRASDANGSFKCDDAMREAIKKFNLTHSMKNYSYTREAKLLKADNEKRLVYCVIYEPSGEGEPISRDTDGQWADESSVEDSAHWFMAYGNSHEIKLNHTQPLSEANVMVESFIAPVDYEINGQLVKQGSWVGVWFIGDDQDWENWKNGVYTGVSIEGNGIIAPEIA